MDKHGFSRKNAVRKFNGRLLKLFTQELRLPSGIVVNLEIIRHPGAALVVPFLSTNRIILLRQFRGAINEYIYELPAGTINNSESPLACAKREILEETGFAAGKLTLLGSIYPVPGYSTEKIAIFKAERLTKGKACFEKDEIIKVMEVSKSQLRRLFLSGKINDAKTICALALCGWI